MSHPTVALFLGAKTWRLCCDDGDTSQLATGEWHADDVVNTAEVMGAAISEFARHVERSLDLLLDASLCLSAPLEFTSSKQLRNRELMLYELEEWLPIAAEDIVADFARHGTCVLAVASMIEPLSELIHQLKHRGIALRFIAPAMLVGLQTHLRRSEKRTEGVLWMTEDGEGDLVLLEEGHARDWLHLPNVVEDLPHQLAFHALECGSELEVTAYVTGAEQEGKLNRLNVIALRKIHLCGRMPLEEQALESLGDLRAGRKEPVLQLTAGWNRDRNAIRPLRRDLILLQMVGIFLLGSLIWLNLRETIAIGDAMAQLQVSQENLFRETFPQAQLPRGISTRFESELKKLSGARGGKSSQLPEQSALPIMHQLLTALPSQMRFRLLDIRIEPQRIDLTGEVQSFADADKLANSLRAQGLLVRPPTTQRLPGQGVSFRLVADAKPAELPRNMRAEEGKEDES